MTANFVSPYKRRFTEVRHQLFIGLGFLILIILSILCRMQTVAFVEVRSSFSSSTRLYPLGRKDWSCSKYFCVEKNTKSSVFVDSNAPYLKEKTRADRKNRKRSWKDNHQHQRSSATVTENLDTIQNPDEIEDWITKQLMQQQNQKRQNNASFFAWANWSVHEQVEFIKYLQHRRAFTSIIPFLSVLDFDQRENKKGAAKEDRVTQYRLVKVYTTALFSISSCIETDQDRDKNNGLDTKAMALNILDQMQRNHVPATTLTYVAIFKNLQGRPADVIQMIKFLEKRELNIPKTERIAWDAEVYHAAIYASRSKVHRSHRSNGGSSNFSKTDSSNDWQISLRLMQDMQRKGIQPTSKTYLAVLDVLARNQAKVPIIKSIINQWKTAKSTGQCNGNEDDRVWATALNACAVTGDFFHAMQFIEEMSKTCQPNLRHCTALLKSFAKGKGDGRDLLALTALDAMMGNKTAVLEVEDGNKQYRVLLPRTDLDIVALNTVLSIVVKAGTFEDAHQLFSYIQRGEFTDVCGNALTPDRITYHNLLAGCRDPGIAKQVVKEMRLSRRNRHGAIPPNSRTYAHAINVCQRAIMPDMGTVNQLMIWANDDQVKPTVFMFASAIWTAQRCGDLSRCLELYDELQRTGCRPNGVVLNGLLCALCDSGMHSRAMDVFRLLKERRFQVSYLALKRLVFATMQLDKLQFKEEKEEILLETLSRLDKYERDISIGSPVFEALISIYGARGDIDNVLTVMNQISGCLDAACFRAILAAYSSCPRSRWCEGVELLHTTIIEESPSPGSVDQIALGHVLMACSRADEFEEGLSLLNLYGIPSNDLPQGFPQIPTVALNALIAACGRGGRPDLSLSLLNEISSRYGLRPDSRSYRSAIIACNQAQHAQKAYEFENMLNEDKSRDCDNTNEPPVEWWECSLALYRRMTEEGLTPDVQTHSSIISSCEAAGEWQRALWVLQTIIDNSEKNPESLNIYCWNAALSACEKGGAWVEALDLYERMLESPFKPNLVTINSMMEALDKADQKELAQSIYNEGLDIDLLDPWKMTMNKEGETISALDLHSFSESMAKAAIRKTMDAWLDEKDSTGGLCGDFVIITGKGKHSASHPVLQKVTRKVLLEYGIEADMDKFNNGRIVVCRRDLLDCFENKSWS